MRPSRIAAIARAAASIALRRIEWRGPILLDQFPFREDPVAAARRSIDTLRLLDAKLDGVDLAQLRAIQAQQDALAAQEFIHRQEQHFGRA